jgi:ubiquinone/menaquinone biosynthesis C-methylase UbiE
VADWLPVLGVALAGCLLVLLGWWLLIASEGVYLGKRVVVWLYDVVAPRYDAIKGFNPLYDQMFLAQPLMERIAPQRQPRVLDVATGSGRLPLALLRYAHFDGQVVGLDASAKMLRLAVNKLRDEPRTRWLLGDGTRLPFASASFDVVTCLEALEFMPQPEAALRELCRVLRPNGLLLITHRRTGQLMPGKIIAPARLRALFEQCGLHEIEIEPWQVDYDRVWGRKQNEGEQR